MLQANEPDGQIKLLQKTTQDSADTVSKTQTDLNIVFYESCVKQINNSVMTDKTSHRATV